MSVWAVSWDAGGFLRQLRWLTAEVSWLIGGVSWLEALVSAGCARVRGPKVKALVQRGFAVTESGDSQLCRWVPAADYRAGRRGNGRSPRVGWWAETFSYFDYSVSWRGIEEKTGVISECGRAGDKSRGGKTSGRPQISYIWSNYCTDIWTPSILITQRHLDIWSNIYWLKGGLPTYLSLLEKCWRRITD